MQSRHSTPQQYGTLLNREAKIVGLPDGQHRQKLYGEIGGGDFDFGTGVGLYMQTQAWQAQLSSDRVHSESIHQFHRTRNVSFQHAMNYARCLET
jgi:hypothetical protein